MAVLLSGTTIGGHSAIHAGNLATHGIITTSNISSSALPIGTGTSTGMKIFYTSLTNNDDWQNSPISIMERGLVGSAQSAAQYAPNLNFHWGSRVSKSLWLDSSGVLRFGEYNASGIPATDGTIAAATFSGALSGNATTATTLATARTIGGVSFNGSANINLPGVNTAGNQNTTGNAASATTLQTTRTINGTNFNGSANIETSYWGTARTITIGGTGKSVNGNGNVSWSLSEIQAEYEHPSGVPRNNLGSPTVKEMALFNEQFNNKTAFLDPSRVTVWKQQTNGAAWEDITANYGDTAIRRFIAGYDSSYNIFIPNGVYSFRIEVTHPAYVFANAVYFYWSSNSHSTKLHLWTRRTDNQNWYQRTSSTTNVSSWPGHLYMPFSSIPWHPSANTSTHYDILRFEFIPTWQTSNPTYANTNIDLYKMQVWGGYPAGTRFPYTVNEYGDFTLRRNLSAPGIVYANGGNSDNWNTAYSWGSHANGGYQSASTAINTSNIASQSVSYLQTTRDTPSNSLQYWQASGLGITEAPSTDWHNTIRMGHGSPLSYYSNTLAVRMTGSGVGDIYTQTIMNGAAQGWKKHWNDGNDGSGSGLDADLLDGYQESAFFRDNQDRTLSVLRFTGVGGDSGNENHGYAIYQGGGGWSSPYPDLHIGYHTGIKIGANTGYGGIRFYNDSTMETILFSVGNTDTNVRVTNNLYIGSAGGWITDLLAGKQAAGSYASASHTHAISEVTGLQAALDDKQAAGSYAAASHTHTIANVTGLQAALDDKQAAGSYAAASHTHTIANVTGLQAALDGKQPSGSYLTGNQTITLSGDVSGSGTTSIAVTVDSIDGRGFVNTGSNSATNADTINSNGISYYTGGVTNFSGNATDGALYSQAYASSWQHQIAGDYRSGQIALRGKNNGTWQAWRTVLDSSNFSAWAQPAGSYAAASHEHDRTFITDSRGAARAPSYYDDRYAQWDFQNTSDTGAGGDAWHGLLTVSKWTVYADSHRQEQLAFTGDDLKRRTATSDSDWGGWKTILDSSNFSTWAAAASHTHDDATTSVAGFMSTADKTKLDGIAASANNYSLPLATASARGGVKIGYTESGKNYPVQLSSEKMYVNVPWTDTNTTYSAGTGLTLSGTTFSVTAGTYAAASHTHTFASLTSKPTTISGYGITDAITTGNIGSQSVSSASRVSITGFGTDSFTYHQTSGNVHGWTGGWASHFIGNHGNGDTYYSQSIIMPFWSVPRYQRNEGGNKVGPWQFITEENIATQSVSFATTSGSATSATSANRLDNYGVNYGSDWNTWGVYGKLVASSYHDASGANKPPTYTYGSFLSFLNSGADSFQIAIPENQYDGTGKSRAMHFRSAWNGTWSSWRQVVDIQNNVCDILADGTSTLIVRQGVGYNQPYNSNIEIHGTVDDWAYGKFRFRVQNESGTEPVYGAQFRIERFSVNTGWQLLGMVPRASQNLEWQGEILSGLSDQRVKENVVSLTDGVATVQQINPVEFDWKPVENVSERDGHDIGFIAQQLEEIVPTAVHTRSDGYKTVKYEKVVPILVQAIKEQQSMIELLSARLDALEQK
jgi:hypothetical protein